MRNEREREYFSGKERTRTSLGDGSYMRQLRRQVALLRAGRPFYTGTETQRAETGGYHAKDYKGMTRQAHRSKRFAPTVHAIFHVALVSYTEDIRSKTGLWILN